uniref:synaptonemal complex protein 3-like n=1 Tax=Nyctereutes procyonoides TaxID=34880 RepID=UPI002443EE94|nr:synaptonemal complex protein 3-like [Nyctereutes procyonoides]
MKFQRISMFYTGGIKQALLAKRIMFEANAKASLKSTNEKIEQGWKIQKQRQNLHFKYSQQFLTLFQKWDTDMRKSQEQEAKLAGMFQEQQKILQQARIVQNQRLEKLRNVYKEFLKSSQALDKDHEHLLTDEQSEVREEIAKMQNKIMREAAACSSLQQCHIPSAVVEMQCHCMMLTFCSIPEGASVLPPGLTEDYRSSWQ